MTKQVAVVGGGVVGVCTAFFLADAGHDVIVIERHHNVAEEASFANAGVVSSGFTTPWPVPNRRKTLISRLFQSVAPVFLHSGMDHSLKRWLSRWASENELDRHRINSLRTQRVAWYSREILKQLREHFQLDYEQTHGVLHLFRTEEDVKLAEVVCGLLSDQGVAHQRLDAEAAREIEPALHANTELTSALHMPQDETGNCPLFAKQMRQIAQSTGVRFHFASTVRAIETFGNKVSLRIDDHAFTSDAVVLAAGVDSAPLLAQLGIHVPIYPVKGYSATASIKNFDEAPRSSVLDESWKVAITRMGGRIRVAGTAELGSRTSELHKTALKTLLKIGADWFPNAANYNSANFWCGARPMLPDGAPLLGATPIRNVYLNIGHGSHGWAMAAGAGKVVSDIVSGFAPDIDMGGLTLARYG